jgi:competence protein ComEA
MKARLIAVFFLLSINYLSAAAESNLKPSLTPPISSVTSKINLNKADLNTLTGSFKGVGKKRAEAIIAYRESHQGFKSLEELAEVKGLGQHFFEVNKDALKEVFTVE